MVTRVRSACRAGGRYDHELADDADSSAPAAVTARSGKRSRADAGAQQEQQHSSAPQLAHQGTQHGLLQQQETGAAPQAGAESFAALVQPAKLFDGAVLGDGYGAVLDRVWAILAPAWPAADAAWQQAKADAEDVHASQQLFASTCLAVVRWEKHVQNMPPAARAFWLAALEQ
jgi:hypothetical protein